MPGISNADGWTTGTTHVDINGDGLQDIYICKASGYRGLKGKNLLFLNLGVDSDGIPNLKNAQQTSVWTFQDYRPRQHFLITTSMGTSISTS